MLVSAPFGSLATAAVASNAIPATKNRKGLAQNAPLDK